MTPGRLAAAAVVLVAAVLLPQVAGPFWVGLVTQMIVFGLLALSVDLLLGHAGLFSICHGSFFAVAAYTTAILQVRHSVPTALAAPAGLVAGTMALLFHLSRIFQARDRVGDYVAGTGPTDGSDRHPRVPGVGYALTPFAFDEGQELSEHTAPFDALVQMLDGEVEVKISGKVFHLRRDDAIVMPAGEPHAVKAVKGFKTRLPMIRSSWR